MPRGPDAPGRLADAGDGALPPGPSAGRLTQADLFHRDPLGFLRSARERYGDVFTIRLAVAGLVVIVMDQGVLPVAGRR